MNKLYYGDNYGIMENKIEKQSIDLIYLDPPFNSNKNYNLMYRNMTGQPLPEQVEAFCDAWTMDEEKQRIANTIPLLLREIGADDEYIAFWQLWMKSLGKLNSPLMAYLIYMVPRLCRMKGILKPTGSIYLHCDSTASHYLKIMMDGIFGHKNFQNEIIWSYNRWPAKSNRFQRMHDTILFYTGGGKNTFNLQYQEPTGSSKKRWAGKQQKVTFDIEGNRLPTIEMEKKSPGVPMNDVWQIPIIAPSAKERLGYPTQKPIALLKRIILASSNPGDVVFDPFCGCGTTIFAAQALDRKWIGCDIAILAIRLVRDILQEKLALSEGRDFVVDGIPSSVESAIELAEHDRFQFQHWIVERVKGFPMLKKTADKGIDGRLYFYEKEELCEMVLSVKSGSIKPADVRDLRGVLEREGTAKMAGFLCIKPPTKAMRQEAASAGLYTDHLGNSYPRIQILTVQEIIEDKKFFNTPAALRSRVDTGQLALGWDW